MNKKIKILVATHKKYVMPNNDLYLPLHVGKEGKKSLGYIGDNTGENISIKNSNYCELTGLYWAWKNLNNLDYIGLCHYRRYFGLKNNFIIKYSKNKFNYILNYNDINNLLENYDLILPQKRKRIFQTLESNYSQQHYIGDLEKCRMVISKLYPNYLNAFDKTMKSHEMVICNMFIMPKKVFDNYCEWLFNILFYLEKELDLSEYSTLQKRVYGFLSERLFNVWLNYNDDLKKVYLPIINMERDSLKIILNKSYKRIMGIKS